MLLETLSGRNNGVLSRLKERQHVNPSFVCLCSRRHAGFLIDRDNLCGRNCRPLRVKYPASDAALRRLAERACTQQG